jgi:hypothetical protein
LEFYRERQATAVARANVAAARHYQAATVQHSFWMRRSFAACSAPADERRQAQTTDIPPSRLRVVQGLKVTKVPVLSGAFIRRAPALCHPKLKRPVAYFGGILLAPLLHEVAGASTADQILERWTKRISTEAALNIMTWMWSVGILVPHPDASKDHLFSARP